MEQTVMYETATKTAFRTILFHIKQDKVIKDGSEYFDIFA